MSLLKVAQNYVSKGVSVIPVGPNKLPLIEWKEFQSRLPTQEELVNWFTDDVKAIAIVTGKISNLTVVDVDVNHGGTTQGLPPTLIAKTQSGGWHFYYKYLDGVPNRAGVRQGIDIRSNGGYCFTAGHRVVVRPKNKIFKYSKSVKIEDLKVGDVVLSFNEKTGQIENKKIICIGNRKVNEQIIIKFGSRKGVLRCTPEHPIYTTSGWKNAGDIKKGDELLHFSREQLGLQLQSHTFTKGIQNRKSKNGGDYQKRYIQTTPPHIERKSKYEEFIESIIEEDKLPVKYVGDGSLIIKHGDLMLHPDFVVEGKKKVIELHIDFHKQLYKDGEKKVLRNSSQEERKKMYELAGWECLLLDASKWGSFNKDTLRLISEVRQSLVSYVCNGKKVCFVHKIYSEDTVYNIEVEDNHNYFIASAKENKKDWYLVHNCVAPPSIGLKGKYEWSLIEEPQPFPADILKVEIGKSQNDWTKLAEGLPAGNRNQGAAIFIGKLLKSFKREEWEGAVWLTALNWNRSNKPPLPEDELRAIFNSITSREIKKEVIEEDSPVVLMSEAAKLFSDDLSATYKTGFGIMDKALKGGVRDGNLVIVVGETGMGKSAFARSITKNMLADNITSIWFTFELSINEMWEKFKEMGMEDGAKIYTPERYVTRKLEWLKKKIVEARDIYKCKVVYIDHLGFLLGDYNPSNGINEKNLNGFSNSLATIYTMICRDLKTIAIQEKIVIVLMWHLKKLSEGKKEADASDVKDSSGVLQECDLGLSVARERLSSGKTFSQESVQDVYGNDTFIKMLKNRRTGELKRFRCNYDKGTLVDSDEAKNALQVSNDFEDF